MSNIIVFDLETTGLDHIKDQIIQFAGLKINKETHEIVEELNLRIRPIGSYNISLQAYFKHGIKPDDLKNEKTLEEVADTIIEFFGDNSNDILTYNGNSFDIHFLSNALNNIGKHIDFLSRNCYDAFLEEKRRNGNTLEETYKRYNNGNSMEDDGLTAHDALSDVKATYSIFKAQQEIQEYKPETMICEDNVIEMKEFNNKIVPCFKIGKYKNIPVEFVNTIDKGYLNWCISDKCSFSNSAKKFISLMLNS